MSNQENDELLEQLQSELRIAEDELADYEYQVWEVQRQIDILTARIEELEDR